MEINKKTKDEIKEMNYEGIMMFITQLRTKVTPTGFTDKSRLEKHFLESYENLIGNDKPSVTEYGGGVPILSLYLLLKGKIDKIISIDNDPSTISELEHITDTLKLPVEIINDDLNSMSEFPDTDMGISVNTLFGYAPDWKMGAEGWSLDRLPVINNDIIGKSKHNRFGVFRFIYNCSEWFQAKEAKETLESNFNIILDLSPGSIRGLAAGYHNLSGDVMNYAFSEMSGYAGVIIGKDRKKE